MCTCVQAHVCVYVYVCVCLYAPIGNKHTKNVIFRLQPTTTKLTSGINRVIEMCGGLIYAILSVGQ